MLTGWGIDVARPRRMRPRWLLDRCFAESVELRVELREGVLEFRNAFALPIAGVPTRDPEDEAVMSIRRWLDDVEAVASNSQHYPSSGCSPRRRGRSPCGPRRGHPRARPDLQGMTTTTQTTTRSTAPSTTTTKRPASLPVRSKLRAGGNLNAI